MNRTTGAVRGTLAACSGVAACLVLMSILMPAVAQAQTPSMPASSTAATKPAGAKPGTPKTPQQTFATPEQAAEALIAAAGAFDVPALTKILGSDGIDLVVTADKVQDERTSKAFAEQAGMKHAVVRDPADSKVAILNVGPEDWPSPTPIIQGTDGKWRFDTKLGRVEVLKRRIGRNELDAIEVCRGYVEAQQEYAFTKHGDSRVNQYAQKIISTPGKQDGLVWRTPDGRWEGPIAEPIAKAIAEGYSNRFEPYHGYYFKILKGQGPAAALGPIDFVVKGAMIGGFALVAAPAEYGRTGIKSFIVSHDGVVYEKDLGEKTLDALKAMTRFNPDKSWSPVETP
jgi:hypothetical protein